MSKKITKTKPLISSSNGKTVVVSGKKPLKKDKNYKYINYHYNKAPYYNPNKYKLSYYKADNAPAWNK